MVPVVPMVPVIGLAGLAGEYEVGYADAPALLCKSEASLLKHGFNVIKADGVMHDGASVKNAVKALESSSFDVLCVCVGTWSEDHHLLDLLDHYDKPVILWAYPAVDTGSLCGAQQICCVLKELGRQYFLVYGETGDLEAINEIGAIARAAAMKNRLKHVKIGTVGGRVRGMTDIACDELEIKDKTGVRIVNIDESELEREYERVGTRKSGECWGKMKNSAGRVTSADKHGTEAARYYLAMKKIMEDHDLEGITIRCYPGYMGKVCLGYSILSEEGMVCGCEGDANGAVAMKMLHGLTGMPVHNTDLLYPDDVLNTILFSHCGSGGFSIAGSREEIHLAPVRLAGSGVCVLFPAKAGKVTLVNLTGRKGTFRMSVMTGESVECGMEFPGNPLKVRFDRNVKDICRQIAKEGTGHHWMAGYGDVSRELEIFCGMSGIKHVGL